MLIFFALTYLIIVGRQIWRSYDVGLTNHKPDLHPCQNIVFKKIQFRNSENEYSIFWITLKRNIQKSL